jgi:hypothetical protein
LSEGLNAKYGFTLLLKKFITMKRLLFFIALSLAFFSCNEGESLTSSEEGMVSTTEKPLSTSQSRMATDAEVARLVEKGVLVLGGSSANEGEKKLPCRWSDDPTGETYGTVDCPHGNCVAWKETSGENERYGIACVGKGEELPGDTGAWRPWQ